ncbi:hypothetical protein AB0A98_06170 [Streptomyces chrestomyceticus]|uniref:hypothetical protein n=1 Tax=Streptomyces chrestomyceticus TaxID=68185 RepID=UPI0033D29A07
MTDTKTVAALGRVICEAMKSRRTPAGIALAIVSSEVWAGRLALTVPDTNWGESTKDVPLAVKERAAISEEVNDDATPADRMRYFCRVLLADSGHRRNDADRLAAALAEANRVIDRAREDAAYWRRRYREESCTAWDDGRPVESEPCPEYNPRAVADRLRGRIAELETVIRSVIIQMGVAPESYKGTASAGLHAAYDRLRAVLREGGAGGTA